MSFLRVSGTKIVNELGDEVILRGAGLGGWMLMENFISGMSIVQLHPVYVSPYVYPTNFTGFPACEFQIRDALSEVLGVQKAEYFFDKYLEHFFTSADAEFFKSLGLNSIRIAVNYRHFESNDNPRTLKPNAFKHLDRVIDICASHGIYTIIDMHAAPGGQSGGWHCDSGSHIAYFWVHKDFQDRLVWLWEQIALRYHANPWIAGYNLLNEPADPSPKYHRLMEVYDRLVRAVRNVDNKHIIFLDGNTFATDFTHFPDDAGIRWENTAFAIHDYAVYGFPSTPEKYTGSEEQRGRLQRTYERKRRWMDDRGFCVWNGEWGPVYARKQYDGEAWQEINETRLHVLRDQLEIYNKDRLSWSIWLYKDIGFQGMVYVSPDTPYMHHFKDFLARKHRLAVDAWGKDDSQVKQIYKPIIDLVRSAVSDESKLKLYPPLWSVEERVTRISRTMLVAEFLVAEWAEMFRGFGEEELDNLAKSFRFENCMKREGLNKALRDYGPEM